MKMKRFYNRPFYNCCGLVSLVSQLLSAREAEVDLVLPATNLFRFHMEI